jgi:hypothetical protein
MKRGDQMKLLLPVCFLLSFPAMAQSQSTTGPATTKGACSPANTGNDNTFVINCGIDKGQGAELIAIMNKILANQLNPADVMAKLDEILRNVHPPRRLSDSQKGELATCLKKKPGRFSIGSLQGNSEAYKYAQDWREVFMSAGWEIEHTDIPIQIFMIGGGMWSGMQIGVHDASPTQGQMAIANGSPEQNLGQCLVGRNDIPTGGRIIPYKDKPTGSVFIQISDQPQQ